MQKMLCFLGSFLLNIAYKEDVHFLNQLVKKVVFFCSMVIMLGRFLALSVKNSKFFDRMLYLHGEGTFLF